MLLHVLIGQRGLENAAEAYGKYIITAMYAKTAQGTTPEDAVKWAASELKKIYEG